MILCIPLGPGFTVSVSLWWLLCFFFVIESGSKPDNRKVFLPGRAIVDLSLAGVPGL
jgi:hypothetical protein